MKTLFKYFIPVVTFVSTLLLADVNNFRFEVIPLETDYQTMRFLQLVMTEEDLYG